MRKISHIAKTLGLVGVISALAIPALSNSHYISETNSILRSLERVYEKDVSGDKIVAYGQMPDGTRRIVESSLDGTNEHVVKDFGINHDIDVEFIKISPQKIAWIEEHRGIVDWDQDGQFDEDSHLVYISDFSNTSCISTNENVRGIKLAGDNLMYVAEVDNRDTLFKHDSVSGLKQMTSFEVDRDEFDVTEDGAYAFISETPGAETMTFVNGANTNTVLGSFSDPILIENGNVYFNDRGNRTLKRVNSTQVTDQVVLRDNEFIRDLVSTGNYMFLVLESTSFQGEVETLYRIVGQNSLSFIANLPLESRTNFGGSESGLYMSTEDRNDNTTITHFERNKGLSTLISGYGLDYKSLISGNKIITENKGNLDVYTVLEIPIESTPIDFSMNTYGSNLEDKFITVNFNVMQGKTVAVQGSVDLENWYTIDSERYFYDGVEKMTRSVEDICWEMAESKAMQDPDPTYAQESQYRAELMEAAQKSFFIRTTTDY